MRVSIRMIGVATTFFWVFLIAFSISALYSVKDLQFNFGNPQISLTSDNKLLFSMPVTIANTRYYNIGFFNITTKISDAIGTTITLGSTVVPVIKKAASITVTHNVTIDPNDLPQNGQNYLFNDTELGINEVVGMRIAEVIPIQASTNFSIPWGAPLYNFMLGTVRYTAYNLTHSSATVPINFENHAPFDLAGDIQIRMYNNAHMLSGEGQTTMYAPRNSVYSGYVDLYVSTADTTVTGSYEVYFATPFLNYGPLVVPYG